MGMITLRLDEPTETALRQAAAADGVSVSAVLRAALAEHLAKRPRRTALERFGTAVGAISVGPTPPGRRDELTEILEERHRRQADESRAERERRDAR